MREPGTVHVAASRSNSSQRLPMISPVLAAVRTRSSKGLGAHAVALAEPRHEGGQRFITDGLVMAALPADKVSRENVSPCRIASLETVQRNCIVENRFAASTNSRACLWRLAPNRQKEIKQHLRIDRLNGMLANGLESDLQCRMPLRLVLVALEFRILSVARYSMATCWKLITLANSARPRCLSATGSRPARISFRASVAFSGPRQARSAAKAQGLDIAVDGSAHSAESMRHRPLADIRNTALGRHWSGLDAWRAWRDPFA